MRAARQAGKNPEATPVNKETSKANPITGRDMFTGITRATKKVSRYVITNPTNPPSSGPPIS